MDDQIQKKIFDPFFSTKEIGDKKGRGLGLSTVFGIVKNHGGFITVTSKKEEGSEEAKAEQADEQQDPTEKLIESVLKDVYAKESMAILADLAAQQTEVAGKRSE